MAVSSSHVGSSAYENEVARPIAFHSLAFLDATADAVFDRFAKLAANLLKTDVALVSLTADSRQWLKALKTAGREAPDIADAVRNAVVASDELLIVPDIAVDQRFLGSSLLAGRPDLRFFAGVPLVTSDGHRIGGLCVLDTRRRRLSARAAETLQELARAAMVHLEQRRQVAALNFQQELNSAIADTSDFQSALTVALTYLGERVSACFCLVSQACAEPGYMQLVAGIAVDPTFKSLVADELAIERFDLASISRGQALLEGQAQCDESMTLSEIPERFSGKRRLVAAGVKCMLSVPLNIGALATAVLVCFSRPKIGQCERDFVSGFVNYLTPLLRGRLREQELEHERILVSHSNRAMRTLLAANHVMTTAKTEADLIADFCRLTVEVGRYTTAVVGFAEHDKARSIRYAAASGPNAQVMLGMKTSWADTPEGHGPSGTAIRENRIVVVRDLRNDPQVALWRHIAIQTHHGSCIAIPLHRADGSVLGVFLICNDEINAADRRNLSFNAEEADLLKELGANMAFGVGAIREQAAHLEARQLRIESERRLSHLLAASPTILYALEHNGEIWRVVEVTENIERIIGVSVETAMSPNWWENRIHPEDRNIAAEAHLRNLQGERVVSRYRVVRKAGDYCWIRDDSVLILSSDGRPERILGAWLDISEKKEADAVIRQLAFFDSLTGLPNRRLMLDRLEADLSEALQSGKCGAVMMIDLDGFKAINDVHGHAAGDQVLEVVAQRLLHCIRNSDTVARLGGDEFVVLLPRVGDDEDIASAQAVALAEKLSDNIKMPIAINGHHVGVASSIGISIFPGHARAPNEILRAADTAMYAARAAAKERAWSNDQSAIATFHPTMLAVFTQQHRIQCEIRAALAQNRFELWLQRQVDTSGNITGAEALIRLRTESGHLIPPLEFIQVAESSGLIVPIGQWIIAEAFSLLSTFDAVRLPRLSINISAIEFRQPKFVDFLLERLQIAAVDPARFTIEITESLLIERLDDTIIKLTKLRDCGLRISIDDFGTGYSSLSYLQRLPIDEIKIDRRFTSEMLSDPRSAKVTRTLITVARTMGFDVVAEGVETAEQAAFLQRFGCHYMQGFLFGRPAPAANFDVEIEADKVLSFVTSVERSG